MQARCLILRTSFTSKQLSRFLPYKLLYAFILRQDIPRVTMSAPRRDIFRGINVDPPAGTPTVSPFDLFGKDIPLVETENVVNGSTRIIGAQRTLFHDTPASPAGDSISSAAFRSDMANKRTCQYTCEVQLDQATLHTKKADHSIGKLSAPTGTLYPRPALIKGTKDEISITAAGIVYEIKGVYCVVGVPQLNARYPTYRLYPLTSLLV